MECSYWQDVVAKLRIDDWSVWAAHVLATDCDDYYNLSEALKCVEAKEVIENTIYAYSNWSAQPYCDQILEKFEIEAILNVYEKIENPNKNMKNGVSYLIEDLKN